MKKHNADDYLKMLKGLLPRGVAWARSLHSNLSKLLHANADELERIEANAYLVIDETNPKTTINGLEDWERVLNLPDDCLPAGNALQERREAVLAKLSDIGRQDLSYWYELAEKLGYDVTIEEHRPFVCGWHECGDTSEMTEREEQKTNIGRLGAEDIRYWLNVIVHDERLVLFRCGESQPVELLGDWNAAQVLECLMQRDKLAHNILTFDYR